MKWLLALVIGVVSCQIQISMVFFVFLMLGILIVNCYATAVKESICFAAVLFLGFVWCHYYNHQLVAWHLPPSQVKKDVMVVGKIVSIPHVGKHSQRFLLSMSRYRNQSQHALLRLSWFSQYVKLRIGDVWQLPVRLKPADGLHNPGGFNYQRYLWLHGIAATGYVYKSGYLLQHASNWSIARLRQSLQACIQHAVRSPPIAALLSALTVGSRALLTPEDWQVFQRTGTSHLVAVSGLHIGMVAILVYYLMFYSLRYSTLVTTRYPAPWLAAAVATMAALSYGLLAGFSLPTQRAAIMVFIAMMVRQTRFIPIWQRWLVAFLMVIVLEPGSVYSASFWLSFSAVGFIMFGMGARMAQMHRVYAWLRLQWVVFLGLLPVTLYFFAKISLVMFLANVVAVPWVEMLIVPICLLAGVVSAFWSKLALVLFNIAALCAKPLWLYLQWLAHFPHITWLHVIPSVWVLILSVLACVLLLLPSVLCIRLLGVLLLLPAIFYKPPTLHFAAFDLTLLDVGQGLSAVVRTQHHVLLYDAGPKTYAGFDAGRSVVLPYLRYLGVSRVNVMMISHGDSDHIGGAAAILKGIEVDRIITSVPHRFVHNEVSKCHSGQSWRWDGVGFMVLYPPAGMPYQDNNSSCVLRVSNGKSQVLLVGDIEVPAERWLLHHQQQYLHASVLVVPHHGSQTSSSEAFIQAVAPRYALFPVGAYNRFGFPAARVWHRYCQMHVKTLKTANAGAISVHLPRQGSIAVTIARKGLLNECYF